jgi:phosphoribosylglycinamide formyltransferase-1
MLCKENAIIRKKQTYFYFSLVYGVHTFLLFGIYMTNNTLITKMNKLAVFASGSGTNAENIIRNFQNEPLIEISCICTNKADAFVIERARNHRIPYLIFSRDDFYHRTTVTDYLEERKTNWIILAGFLWLVPHSLIDKYQGRIINIHPALLPNYGGKGMYGHHVHKAVIDAGEKESGITIHYIDHEYDRGDIIFQARCPVFAGDTAGDLAARVHDLEYEHFPRVIKETVLGHTS